MIKVDDKIINTPIVEIMNILKADLTKHNIQKLKDMKCVGDDLQITCPIHKGGNESNPSAGVLLTPKGDTPAGFCHCFVCQYKATLPKLISDCFNIQDNGEFGKMWLLTNFANDDFQERESFRVQERSKVKPREYVSESELEQYRYYHPYMYKRKLTDEIISKFDVGYDRNTDCITFPTNDEYGNCLFITRRSVKGKFFNYPKNVEKPVYGLDKIPTNCKSVIVCESILNALTCWVYGYPAIALLGLGTEHQYEILKKSDIRNFILGFDGDSAGDSGAQRFIKNFNQNCSIKLLTLPRGKDINDLTKEEFEKLLRFT